MNMISDNELSPPINHEVAFFRVVILVAHRCQFLSCEAQNNKKVGKEKLDAYPYKLMRRGNAAAKYHFSSSSAAPCQVAFIIVVIKA